MSANGRYRTGVLKESLNVVSVSTVKRCGGDGPNLGFPALTHDHIAVQNWTQSTCSHLAVVLSRLPFWLGKRGQTSLLIPSIFAS